MTALRARAGLRILNIPGSELDSGSWISQGRSWTPDLEYPRVEAGLRILNIPGSEPDSGTDYPRVGAEQKMLRSESLFIL